MPSRNHNPIKPPAQLLKPEEAARLLNVSDRTILDWIAEDSIPYVKLPGPESKRSYRIPLQGLLDSLSGTYDLAAQLESVYAVSGESAPDAG